MDESKKMNPMIRTMMGAEVGSIMQHKQVWPKMARRAAFIKLYYVQ